MQPGCGCGCGCGNDHRSFDDEWRLSMGSIDGTQFDIVIFPARVGTLLGLRLGLLSGLLSLEG